MRFKGVNVGKVTAIGFDPLSPDNVLIQIEIDEQAPITQSTFGTLGFQGVTGLAFVQLDDAGESTVALLPGAASPAHIPMRGTLDQLASGVDTLSATGQAVNAATLPRLNRTVDETARTARQLSRTVDAVKDNPQALLFGNGRLAPSPGEPGFSATPAKP